MISIRQYDSGSVSSETILEPARILLAWRGYFAKLNVARLLRKEGYTVDIAHNAQGILEALQSRDYACILLDVEMPGMNGIMTAHRIRQGWREQTPPLLARLA
ncbi:MAG: response regulator, partial [Verrucomicrobiota bacterium]